MFYSGDTQTRIGNIIKVIVTGYYGDEIIWFKVHVGERKKVIYVEAKVHKIISLKKFINTKVLQCDIM